MKHACQGWLSGSAVAWMCELPGIEGTGAR